MTHELSTVSIVLDITDVPNWRESMRTGTHYPLCLLDWLLVEVTVVAIWKYSGMVSGAEESMTTKEVEAMALERVLEITQVQGEAPKVTVYDENEVPHDITPLFRSITGEVTPGQETQTQVKAESDSIDMQVAFVAQQKRLQFRVPPLALKQLLALVVE